MKTLHIFYYFPYQWYRLKKIKIRSTSNELLGYLKYSEETKMDLPEDIKGIKIRVYFYKKSIPISQENNFVLLYCEVMNIGLPTLKSIQLKNFTSDEERQKFRKNLYLKETNSNLVKEKNIVSFLLGTFISLILMFTPFYPPIENSIHLSGSRKINMAFIIGLISFISLILMYFEKKIPYYSYKNRLYATILAFGISLYYLQTVELFIPVFLLTLTFFLKTRNDLMQINLSAKPS